MIGGWNELTPEGDWALTSRSGEELHHQEEVQTRAAASPY